MTRSRSSSFSSIKSATSSVLSHLIPGRRKSQTSTRPENPILDTSFATQSALGRDDAKLSGTTSPYPNFSRPFRGNIPVDSGYSSATTTPLSASSRLSRSAENTLLFVEPSESSGRPSLGGRSGNGSIDDLTDWGKIRSPTISRWEDDEGPHWRSDLPSPDEDDWISGSGGANPPSSIRPPSPNDTGDFVPAPRERSNTGFSIFSHHSNNSTSSNGNRGRRDSISRRSLDILRSIDSHVLHPKVPRMTRVSQRNGSWLGADDFAQPLPESLRIYPPERSGKSSSESYEEITQDEQTGRTITSARTSSDSDRSASDRVKSYPSSVHDTQHTSDHHRAHHQWRDRLNRTFSRSSHNDNSIFSGGHGRKRSMFSSIMDVFSRNPSKSSVRYDDTPKVQLELDGGQPDRTRPRLSRTASGTSTATTRLGRMRDELVGLFSGLTRSLYRSDGGPELELQTTEDKPYLTLNLSGDQSNSDGVPSQIARTNTTGISDRRNRKRVNINRELYDDRMRRERDLNSFDAGIRDRNRFHDQRSGSVGGRDDLVVYEVGHLPA